MDEINTKEKEFPREITLKAIFYTRAYLKDMLINICNENNVTAHITEKESKNGKFISYTITAIFDEEAILNAVCNSITHIEGIVTMF